MSTKHAIVVYKTGANHAPAEVVDRFIGAGNGWPRELGRNGWRAMPLILQFAGVDDDD